MTTAMQVPMVTTEKVRWILPLMLSGLEADTRISSGLAASCT